MTGPWKRHARQWTHVGPPLRPSPEDLAVPRATIAEWIAVSGRTDPSILVMGVTPELCAMRPEPDGRAIAVDQSIDMIRSVWPGRASARDHAVSANWRFLPLATRSIDLVLGDGFMTNLPYPTGYASSLAEMHRLLRTGGRCVIRCFVQPDGHEMIGDVFSDLSGGRIGNFHVLKWRLAMALQPDARRGVPVKEIWNTLLREWGRVDLLSERFGWPLAEVRTIDAYGDVETRYSFPTLAQTRESFAAAGFHVVGTATPSYELGERCPTFVLASHDSGTSRT